MNQQGTKGWPSTISYHRPKGRSKLHYQITNSSTAYAPKHKTRRVPAGIHVSLCVAPLGANRQFDRPNHPSLVVAPLGLAPGADRRVLPLVLRDADVRVGRQAGGKVRTPTHTHTSETARYYNAPMHRLVSLLKAQGQTQWSNARALPGHKRRAPQPRPRTHLWM